jgi:hypothetical protein
MKLLKKYTMKHTKKPQSNKNKRSLRLDKKYDNPSLNVWRGSGTDILFGLLYLIKKYDNLCFPLLATTNQLKTMTFSMICKYKAKYANKKDDYKMRFPTNDDTLARLIQSCSTNHRFIALPAFIIYDDCKEIGHMNILLFDTLTLEVERFEPYGKKGYTKKEQRPFTWFDEYLKEWLQSKDLPYKYISTKNCPSIGPQELEEIQLEKGIETVIQSETDPSGFCGVWGLLFLDLRLSYPELTTKEVMKILMKLIKNNNSNIRNWIRNYSVFITNHRNKFINNYKNRNNINNKNKKENEWFPSLEREVNTIFKERIYGKSR